MISSKRFREIDKSPITHHREVSSGVSSVDAGETTAFQQREGSTFDAKEICRRQARDAAPDHDDLRPLNRVQDVESVAGDTFCPIWNRFHRHVLMWHKGVSILKL